MFTFERFALGREHPSSYFKKGRKKPYLHKARLDGDHNIPYKKGYTRNIEDIITDYIEDPRHIHLHAMEQ